jgi:hypothetical protein
VKQKDRNDGSRRSPELHRDHLSGRLGSTRQPPDRVGEKDRHLPIHKKLPDMSARSFIALRRSAKHCDMQQDGSQCSERHDDWKPRKRWPEFRKVHDGGPSDQHDYERIDPSLQLNPAKYLSVLRLSRRRLSDTIGAQW